MRSKLTTLILTIALMLLSSCGGKPATVDAWKHITEQQVSKYLLANTAIATTPAEEFFTRALQIDAFIATLENESKSLAPKAAKDIASDIALLRKHQGTYLGEASGLAKGADKTIAPMLLERFKEGSGPLEDAKRSLRKLDDELAQLPSIPQSADAPVLIDRAKKALALSGKIKAFQASWSQLAIEGVNTEIENAVAPFIRFRHQSDLPLGKPYEVLDQGAIDRLKIQLDLFVRHCPGTISTDDQGQEHFKPGHTWSLLADQDASGKPQLYQRLMDDNDIADRDLSTAIVEDMFATYGDIEPAATFRKEVVRDYSESTGLTSPSSSALIVALIASIALFGGLAHAIYLAAAGGRRKDKEEPRP